MSITDLCLRDLDNNGIENDQSNLGNNYVCLHNKKRAKGDKKIERRA